MNNLLTNKYFCIAVLIALLVVVFFYLRKRSCETEGMKNFSTNWMDKLRNKWFHKRESYQQSNDSKEKDKLGRPKKSKKGHESFLRESDYGPEFDRDLLDRIQDTPPRKKRADENNPKPLDPRPDLGNCPPCICPGDKLLGIDEAEKDFDEKLIRKYLMSKLKSGKFLSRTDNEFNRLNLDDGPEKLNF